MKIYQLHSWCLLLGIAVGFGGATWEGHRAARYSKPSGFHRFHQRISPDAMFYPPYAMLESLALARWQPGKTIVILGGNSIFNGVGQPESELWSERLQTLLGERYVVVNLAFRGSFPSQGGALVAEALLARGLPVLYVANTHPYAGAGQPTLGHYGYLYWQARAQHRLVDYVPRDRAIKTWLAHLSAPEKKAQQERQLDAELESLFRAHSLWHHVGYRHAFTVWSPLLADRFWRPRAQVPDNEPAAPPVGERFRLPAAPELEAIRNFNAWLSEPAATGGWQWREGERARLAQEIENAFPPALRARMLIVIDRFARHYLEQLEPAEKARHEFTVVAAAALWREHGISALTSGENFLAEDYIDRVHLSGTGGTRHAALVAAEITRLDAR